MFEVLPESTRAKRSSLGSGLTSLALHGGVIAIAAIATRASLDATSPPAYEVLIPPFAPHTPVRSATPPTRGPAALPPAPIESVVIPILPPLVPAMPPVSTSTLDDLHRRITLTSPEQFGETVNPGERHVPAPSGIWSAHLVDEPASVLAAAALRYPPGLEAAGISGQVVLEFVVDSTGRAEPASVRVVSSTHSGFEASAREAVLATRFRPGRSAGNAVRQLVRQTMTFVNGER